MMIMHLESNTLEKTLCKKQNKFRRPIALVYRRQRHELVYGKRCILSRISAEEDSNQQQGDEEVPTFGGNPQFAAALKQALQRQGKDALTKGGKQASDEKKPSPAEEVLHQALRQARRNVLTLKDLKKRIEGAIEEEEKQFERIQFGLKRATADAAYIRTLEKLRAQAKLKSEEVNEELVS